MIPEGVHGEAEDVVGAVGAVGFGAVFFFERAFTLEDAGVGVEFGPGFPSGEGVGDEG